MDNIVPQRKVTLCFVCFFSLLLILPTITLIRHFHYFELPSFFYSVIHLLQLATVLYIAFNAKFKSSVLLKIGCSLYATHMLYFVVLRLFDILGFSYNPFVLTPIATFVLYTPGLLLIALGCKLWLASKLLLLNTLLIGFVESIWILLWFYGYAYDPDFYYLDFYYLDFTNGIIAAFNFVSITALVCLTTIQYFIQKGNDSQNE